MTTTLPVLDRIRQLLVEHHIEFREIHHEPTRTSEESARMRGEELRIGGKALVMKGDDEFGLYVLPADCKLQSSLLRNQLGYRKLRFATPEELMQLTGLVPGSVPPFGKPILPFDLYLDELLLENPRIAFNAGSLTDSIILAMSDYLRLVQPTRVLSFSTRDAE